MKIVFEDKMGKKTELTGGGGNEVHLYQHNIFFYFVLNQLNHYTVNIILLNTQEEKYTSTTFTNYLTSDFTYVYGKMRFGEKDFYMLSNISKGTNNQIYVRYLNEYNSTDTSYLSFPINDTNYKNTFKDNVVQIL